jgi:mannitol operon transcriptional antiterminator
LPPFELASLSDKISEAMAQGFLVGDRSVALQDETASQAWELAARLAREAGKYLHARLFHDEELVNCLALELSRGGAPSLPGVPTTERHGRKAQTPINPLYGFTQRVLCPIMESYGYLPSERLMSSVAGHLETALEKLGRTCSRRKVWVICGAGVATARNLITRLNLHLPQLEIMGLASALELARDMAMVSGADAIISTIPLDWVTAIPVLRVSPLLAAEDVAMLKAALVLHPPQPSEGSKASPVGGTSLVELLSPRMIQRDVVAGDWEEVVDRAGSILLSAGAVWPSYVEAMKDMIHLYGPYVVVAPGAALLHAGPEMGGKRLAMSLVILRDPVPFGHEVHDPVQLALAFSSIDHSTHVRAVMEAMALLSKPQALRSIREAAAREGVLQAIQERTAVAGVSLST